MHTIMRSAFLDRISEDPESMLDFLVSMRVLGSDPKSAEVLPEMTSVLLESQLGRPLPESDGAEVISAEFNDIAPTEYRADVAIKMTKGSDIAYAVIIETQQRRDKRKRFSWPVYVATLHARLECPVFLVVTCPDEAVARWCEQPIVIGAEWFMTMSPIVIDIQRVPVVTDPADAERFPELSVLSARAHGATAGLVEPVLRAFVAGLGKVSRERVRLYYDFVWSALPDWARLILEELMTIADYEYQSDFARGYFNDGRDKGRAEGRAEGEAQGEAKALVTVLTARGIAVSEAARARILECTDTDQLDTWLGRAVTVDKVDELFD